MPQPLGYFNQRLARCLKHLPDPSKCDSSLLTLKGHLLVEEVLLDLIVLVCKDSSAVSEIELSFRVKVGLARALHGTQVDGGYEIPSYTWDAAEALNSLRNEYAHRLEGPNVEKKLQRFLTIALQECADPLDGKSTEKKLWLAINFLICVLTSLEAHAKASVKKSGTG